MDQVRMRPSLNVAIRGSEGLGESGIHLHWPCNLSRYSPAHGVTQRFRAELRDCMPIQTKKPRTWRGFLMRLRWGHVAHYGKITSKTPP